MQLWPTDGSMVQILGHPKLSYVSLQLDDRMPIGRNATFKETSETKTQTRAFLLQPIANCLHGIWHLLYYGHQ